MRQFHPILFGFTTTTAHCGDIFNYKDGSVGETIGMTQYLFVIRLIFVKQGIITFIYDNMILIILC